ncbi:MAG: hypothetical protein LBC08_05070 [Campylobacteraceae bacterium]|jgi:hypothetical protein|nr:hypothetical protein [Campylobacteraceae bacterium]
MAYTNEKISKEDFEKYDLEKINKRLPYGSPDDYWAIDRQRNIWFREYYRSEDRENSGVESYTVWDFYWKGSLISTNTITLKKIPYTQNNGVFYAYLKILDIVTTEKSRVHRKIDKKENKILINFPKELLSYKQEILKDLKEAFEVSQIGLGIYIRDDEKIVCKVDLEYEGQLI